jgi:microcystin-dependent protein
MKKNCNCKGQCGCANGGSGGGSNSANSNAQLGAQISNINTQITTILSSIAPFLSGHPILMLQNANDIASFNSIGIGSGTWAGWGVCNGATYVNTLVTPNTSLISPNLLDKFIVGAGGTYLVGNTGGAATVSLTGLQNGVHTHTITDPGHTHTIVDPGHLHNVTDPGHVHSGSSVAVTGVTGVTSSDGLHHHGVKHLQNIQYGGGGTTAPGGVYGTPGGPDSGADYLQDSGVHSHTVTIDPFNVNTAVQTAFTGVNILNAFTGITNQSAVTGITIDNSGAGDPHENLPPFYSCLFVIKL